jgi:transglutaminase-like putative cysteine protease
LALLSLPLVVTFATIDSARWVTGLPPLPLEVVLALVLGAYVVQRNISWKACHLIGLGIGLAMAVGQGLWLLGGMRSMTMGIILLTATWWAAYATAWLAYRRRQPVPMVLPCLLVLIVVIGFLSARYYVVLPLYLLASAPALAYFQSRWWRLPDHSSSHRFTLLAGGMAAMVVIVAMAWFIPSPEFAVRPGVMKKLEDPFFSVVERYSNLLTSVPNRKDWPRFDLTAELPFTGPIALEEDVLLVVKSPMPHRWRMRVYETYTPQGWSRPDEEIRSPRTVVIPTKPFRTSANHEAIAIEVRTLSSMALMASAGEPIAAESPGRLELSPTPRFTVNFGNVQTSYVPSQVEGAWTDVIDALLSNEEREEEQESLADLLSAQGLRMTGDLSSPEMILTLERTEPGPQPRVALRFEERRSPPRTYQTVGVISTASPETLRQGGTDLPRWVTDRYLQLPPAFPETIKERARQASAGQQTPYDIAIAIQNYLRTLPYSTTDVKAPPPGVDGVEWFIFTQRIGFCNYYASAMITMLRSLGIPARLVTGFAPGEWDDQRGAWVVRAKHYHAWPEVYIAGHGWVEFEPTPSNVQPSLQLLGQAYEEYDTDLDLGESTATCLAADFEGDAACEDGTISTDGLSAISTDRIVQPTVGIRSGGPDNIRTVLYWLAGFSGLALVAVLLITWAARRPAMPRGPVAKVFSTMQLMARLAGAKRRPGETAKEFGAHLASMLPRHTSSITQVTDTYTLTRYSRSKELDAVQMEELRSEWNSIRWALLFLIVRRLRPSLPFHPRVAPAVPPL